MPHHDADLPGFYQESVPFRVPSTEESRCFTLHHLVAHACSAVLHIHAHLDFARGSRKSTEVRRLEFHCLRSYLCSGSLRFPHHVFESLISRVIGGMREVSGRAATNCNRELPQPISEPPARLLVRWAGRTKRGTSGAYREEFGAYDSAPLIDRRGNILQRLRNANRSELIVSASVVGMPCGKSL